MCLLKKKYSLLQTTRVSIFVSNPKIGYVNIFDIAILSEHFSVSVLPECVGFSPQILLQDLRKELRTQAFAAEPLYVRMSAETAIPMYSV